MNSVLVYRRAAFLLLWVLVYLLALYTMERTGVPRSYAIGLSAVFCATFWSVPVFRGATTSSGRFLFANHEGSTAINSLAIAVATLLPVILIDGGALFYANPSLIIMFAIAMTGGLGLSGLLISRKMREEKAADICECLLARHDGPLAVRCIAIVIAFCCVGLLAASLAGGGLIAGWFFNLGPGTGMAVFGAMVVLAAGIGGMNSVTRLAGVAGFMLILALNLPLLAQSLEFSGLPFGHFTFGNAALAPLWDLEDQLRSLNIETINSSLGDLSDIDYWSADLQIAAACLVGLGMVVSPLVLQQYGVSTNGESASISAGRALLIGALIILSLFAFLAFSKLGAYQTILGTSLSDARVVAPFLYEWGGNKIPLALLCGEVVADRSALLAACGGDPGFIINIEDISLNRHLLGVAGAELAGMPFAFTGLLSVSVILAVCSFATMTALALTGNLITAFYVTLPGKVASGRLFMMRLFIIILVALIGFAAINFKINTLLVSVFVFSLLAASLLPAMVATFQFNIKSSVVLGWSVGAGFTASMLYFALAKFGVDLTRATGDELKLPFPGLAAVPAELGALYGLPFAVAVLLIAHFIGKYGLSRGTSDNPDDLADEA